MRNRSSRSRLRIRPCASSSSSLSVLTVIALRVAMPGMLRRSAGRRRSDRFPRRSVALIIRNLVICVRPELCSLFWFRGGFSYVVYRLNIPRKVPVLSTEAVQNARRSSRCGLAPKVILCRLRSAALHHCCNSAARSTRDRLQRHGRDGHHSLRSGTRCVA